MKPTSLLPALAALAIPACGGNDEYTANSNQQTKVETYGTLPDGREVKIFTFSNENGMTAKVTEYGAILVSLEVPDKNGNARDVTLGYDTLEGWLTNTSYFGATVGRYGNRIANGKFTIDGVEYTLATNNAPNDIPCHLHGGEKGFDKVLWSGKPVPNGVELAYTSKDGEEGYPGTLDVKVTYTLNNENELLWTAEAVTGKTTPVNIVQHTYWNLSGDPRTSINDHRLMLNANHFLPTDRGLIPTGRFEPVVDTPFDFRKPAPIGKRVDDQHLALKIAGGYDHCWVLNRKKEEGVQLAARLTDPQTGRTMEVHANQPGIQFYGGNFLDGAVTGKNGVNYEHRTGLCLETQIFPDSPNKQDNPAFTGAILRPGETYTHKMINKFSW